MRCYSKIIPVFIILLLSEFVSAQINEGGTPLSFSKNVSSTFQEIFITPPDLNLLAEEDAKQYKDGSYRFAVLLPTSLNISNSGTWEDAGDGSRIWRLKLFSEGAEAISLYFDDFKLPKGGKLFLYDETGKQLLGAFSSNNNRESGHFATGLIYP
jgi:hypothetical protein